MVPLTRSAAKKARGESDKPGKVESPNSTVHKSAKQKINKVSNATAFKVSKPQRSLSPQASKAIRNAFLRTHRPWEWEEPPPSPFSNFNMAPSMLTQAFLPPPPIRPHPPPYVPIHHDPQPQRCVMHLEPPPLSPGTVPSMHDTLRTILSESCPGCHAAEALARIAAVEDMAEMWDMADLFVDSPPQTESARSRYVARASIAEHLQRPARREWGLLCENLFGAPPPSSMLPLPMPAPAMTVPKGHITVGIRPELCSSAYATMEMGANWRMNSALLDLP